MTEQVTVLFVDDEPLILRMIKRELARSQFRLLFAESADAALAIVGAEPVHVVVSDMRMPAMTGLQFLDIMRAVQPHVIRVMLTGQADMESTLAAINKAHVHHFLTKPWDPTVLRETLQHCAELVSGVTHLADTKAGAVITLDPDLEQLELDTFLREFQTMS